MTKKQNKIKFTKSHKITLLGVFAIAIILLFKYLVPWHKLLIFNPQGVIAQAERSLIIQIVLIMLVVVVPAIVMTFFFAWKYRASNTEAAYAPDWDRNTELEFIWWGLPCIIVIALAIITWKSTHQLDPFKPLESSTPPITIQVIALQWKWLFIYPDQNIATVNFIEFPSQTPINFELTADAPMNSFWIPQLGGQMYAMSGMSSKLHLMADAPGDYAGSATEISGRGFAGMKFTARAVSRADFDAWVQSVKQSPKTLDLTEYNKLATPSENTPIALYGSALKDLYMTTVMKYMAPTTDAKTETEMNHSLMPTH